MGQFIIGAVIALFAATYVDAQPIGNETKWHWVWVKPDYGNKGWKVFEGEAVVKFTASRFDATLHGIAPDEQPTLHLVGSLTGKRIVATGALMYTDASPEHYTGLIEGDRTKLSDPSNGWGFDRMMLRAGSSFVGLYRQVWSDR